MSRPLYPQGKNPYTHYTGGWVGHRAGLDVLARRKNPSPYRKLNPSLPTRSTDTIPTELLDWQRKCEERN